MARPTKAHIDLDALRHNYSLACQLAPGAQSIAVIKANAYGHGAIECGKALESMAPALAVACIEEAMELRSAGVNKPILLLEGPFSPEEISVAEQHNFWLMLSNQKQVDWIAEAQCQQPLTVWLKADSGMHRLGFQGEAFGRAYQQLRQLPHVHDEIVLASHFAAADEVDNGFTRQQIANFRDMIPDQSAPISLSNSAGVLAWQDSHGQWNRPGYMLYGNTPLDQQHSNAEPLQPVMQLVSEVIAIHQVPKGDSVGYGCSWTAERDSVIATVAIGYGDGYPRQAPSGTPVLINGQTAPLAGRVSMDMITVDVTDIGSVTIGDPVELWGRNVCVNQIAQLCGTIGYELLTRMPLRTPRIYS
ncbi:MAG: alanine racemase [Candidatus Pelagadaptatus aseana]|uniref:alanine racemase n=1 Tax=Candidatus Pelagadaptatus aseana TaxID=3120508 RepID=UPI0039B272B1